MFISLLQYSPMIALAWLAAIVVSLTIHEFSHALMGKQHGDRTAEREGRLTLNPLAHVDPIGFMSMLFLGFGWAKPVPYNPYNLRDPKWDQVRIALAGPISNLLLAAVAAMIIRILISVGAEQTVGLLMIFLVLVVILNVSLALFNLIPVHPLDGSKLVPALFSDIKYRPVVEFVMNRGPQVLMMLVFVSLLTDINVFFFIQAPSQAVCNGLVGGDCWNILFSFFG